MIDYLVRSSKGQLKIQQMAFVLVAFVILFSLAGLFYLSVKSVSLKEDVEDIKSQQAQELVRKLAGTPEFSWTVEDCASCVDLDKVLVLKENRNYNGFWGQSISLLKIRKVYPLENNSSEIECTRRNYPECNTITIMDSKKDYATEEAYVSICHFDEGKVVCELGKLLVGVST